MSLRTARALRTGEEFLAGGAVALGSEGVDLPFAAATSEPRRRIENFCTQKSGLSLVRTPRET